MRRRKEKKGKERKGKERKGKETSGSFCSKRQFRRSFDITQWQQQQSSIGLLSNPRPGLGADGAIVDL